MSDVQKPTEVEKPQEVQITNNAVNVALKKINHITNFVKILVAISVVALLALVTTFGLLQIAHSNRAHKSTLAILAAVQNDQKAQAASQATSHQVGIENHQILQILLNATSKSSTAAGQKEIALLYSCFKNAVDVDTVHAAPLSSCLTLIETPSP